MARHVRWPFLSWCHLHFGLGTEHPEPFQGLDREFDDQPVGGQGGALGDPLDHFPLPGPHADVLVDDAFGGSVMVFEDVCSGSGIPGNGRKKVILN